MRKCTRKGVSAFFAGKYQAYFTLKRRRNTAFPNLEAQLNLGIVFEGAARLEEKLVNAPVVEFIPIRRIHPCHVRFRRLMHNFDTYKVHGYEAFSDLRSIFSWSLSESSTWPGTTLELAYKAFDNAVNL